MAWSKVGLLAVAVISLFVALPASAKSTDKYLTVPVLFATSRAPTSKDNAFGAERNLHHQDHGISFGIATVRIKSDRLPADLRSLGIEKSTPGKKVKVLKIDPLKSIEQLDDSIREAYSKSANHEIALFVHGYNCTFADALLSAAALEVSLKEPVVLFSWPSQAKVHKYMIDECNAEWSLRDFQLCMQNIEKEVGAEHMMTVSHSMGNRLINWYMQSRSDQNKLKELRPQNFKEVVLTSPDIDRATFKNYFYKVADNTDKIRMYISSKDKALKASGFFHGNDRAGEAEQQSDLKWEVPAKLPNTQVVNFTAVDSGWIGHSIQFDLISAMHQTNSAGEELECVPDKKYPDSYVTIKKIGK